MKKTILGTTLLISALVIFSSTLAFAWTSMHASIDHSANSAPVSVEDIPGTNDVYVEFVYWGGCKSSPGCWSANFVNRAHINRHNGLDGIYECSYDGSQLKTRVKLMVRRMPGGNPWSIRVKW